MFIKSTGEGKRLWTCSLIVFPYRGHWRLIQFTMQLTAVGGAARGMRVNGSPPLLLFLTIGACGNLVLGNRLDSSVA